MAKPKGKRIDLEHLKKKLLDEREHMLGNANIDSSIDAEESGDMLEDNVAIASHASESLVRIDAALRMIDQGTYGICSECNSAIPTERLEIMPDCTMCVKCSSQTK